MWSPVHAAELQNDADATKVYGRAVLTMRALPAPTFATFATKLTGKNSKVNFIRNSESFVDLGLGSSSNDTLTTIPTVYREADHSSVLTLIGGKRGGVRKGLFDPTWSGVEL